MDFYAIIPITPPCSDNNPVVAKMTKKSKFLSDKKQIIEQDVKGYDRDIELVEFICACPNCPICHNEKMYAHPNRKYCDPEAMLTHRQKQRAIQALMEGRVPGKVGRPRKNVPEHVTFMWQATDTAFYKVDWSENQGRYLEELSRNQSAIPKGVTEIFKASRPACEQVVEALYDLYHQYVINDKWIELSEEQVNEIKAMLT
jgi:hypothetical protein